MKVLIVKTSSMGDIVHTLPALTDASNAIADIRFDWVVEEGFKDIPKWHSSVDRVIPVSIRRWRKAPLKAWCSGEWAEYRRQLQLEEYEAVIDAQGLIKSAVLVAAQAQGDVHGYDRQSIKEPLASKFYQHSYAISKEQHAVERIRQLFAKALHYEVRQKRGDYGIRAHFESGTGDYLVFNHSTTRADKHYPEVYWRELIALAA
ncbi:MAG: lipopolysaccharide heptosyltransferase I, partial [Pseudomonadales bacterium]